MGNLLVGGSVDKRSSVVDSVVGERGGVDEGSSVVDEGLVGAGNSLVLHVSVVLGIISHFGSTGNR